MALALHRSVEDIEAMPASEFVAWAAFEQVYGPLLLHERIDIGFSRIAFTLAQLLSSSRRLKFRDFLPEYLRGFAPGGSSEQELRLFMEGLVANDQHPDS